jgi:hypothetical protein
MGTGWAAGKGFCGGLKAAFTPSCYQPDVFSGVKIGLRRQASGAGALGESRKFASPSK